MLPGGGCSSPALRCALAPAQAACTAKELKELVSEPNLAVHAPSNQMALSPEDQAAIKQQRPKRRLYEIITQVRARACPLVAWCFSAVMRRRCGAQAMLLPRLRVRAARRLQRRRRRFKRTRKPGTCTLSSTGSPPG